MSREITSIPDYDASDFQIGIVAARYNTELVEGLLQRVISTLLETGVPEENIEILRVPGSHELPYGVTLLGKGGLCDCVIALGVVLAGETNHHDVIAVSTAHAFQKIALEEDFPVINGVLVCSSREQAEERVHGALSRGPEFAKAAIEMAHYKLTIADVWESLEDDILNFGEDDFDDEDFDDEDPFDKN